MGRKRSKTVWRRLSIGEDAPTNNNEEEDEDEESQELNSPKMKSPSREMKPDQEMNNTNKPLRKMDNIKGDSQGNSDKNYDEQNYYFESSQHYDRYHRSYANGGDNSTTNGPNNGHNNGAFTRSNSHNNGYHHNNHHNSNNHHRGYYYYCEGGAGYGSANGGGGGGGGRGRGYRNPSSDRGGYHNHRVDSGWNTDRYHFNRFRRSRSYPVGEDNYGGNARLSYPQDEYTKITTPRQDVLFKKGYLSKKKETTDEEKPNEDGSTNSGDSQESGNNETDGTAATIPNNATPATQNDLAQLPGGIDTNQYVEYSYPLPPPSPYCYEYPPEEAAYYYHPYHGLPPPEDAPPYIFAAPGDPRQFFYGPPSMPPPPPPYDPQNGENPQMMYSFYYQAVMPYPHPPPPLEWGPPQMNQSPEEIYDNPPPTDNRQDEAENDKENATEAKVEVKEAVKPVKSYVDIEKKQKSNPPKDKMEKDGKETQQKAKIDSKKQENGNATYATKASAGRKISPPRSNPLPKGGKYSEDKRNGKTRSSPSPPTPSTPRKTSQEEVKVRGNGAGATRNSPSKDKKQEEVKVVQSPQKKEKAPLVKDTRKEDNQKGQSVIVDSKNTETDSLPKPEIIPEENFNLLRKEEEKKKLNSEPTLKNQERKDEKDPSKMDTVPPIKDEVIAPINDNLDKDNVVNSLSNDIISAIAKNPEDSLFEVKMVKVTSEKPDILYETVVEEECNIVDKVEKAVVCELLEADSEAEEDNNHAAIIVEAVTEPDAVLPEETKISSQITQEVKIPDILDEMKALPELIEAPFPIETETKPTISRSPSTASTASSSSNKNNNSSSAKKKRKRKKKKKQAKLEMEEKSQSPLPPKRLLIPQEQKLFPLNLSPQKPFFFNPLTSPSSTSSSAGATPPTPLTLSLTLPQYSPSATPTSLTLAVAEWLKRSQGGKDLFLVAQEDSLSSSSSSSIDETIFTDNVNTNQKNVMSNPWVISAASPEDCSRVAASTNDSDSGLESGSQEGSFPSNSTISKDELSKKIIMNQLRNNTNVQLGLLETVCCCVQ